jgi:hypothetical protein
VQTPAEYDRFSESLRTRLENDPRVLALVALGSTAVPARRDAYSDHDFWVIVTPGARTDFLEDGSWLPDTDDIVASARARTRYLVVLYSGGHVLELGVFEPDQLSEGDLGAYRVVFDRQGIEQRLGEIAMRSRDRPTRQEERWRYERFLVTLLTGATRAARGEYLSAHKYITSFALDFLLGLLVRNKPSTRPELIDSLDPWRRFEQLYPTIAVDLHAAVRRPAIEAALRLLDIAERELRAVLPDYPARSAEVVRSALHRLAPNAGGS